MARGDDIVLRLITLFETLGGGNHADAATSPLTGITVPAPQCSSRAMQLTTWRRSEASAFEEVHCFETCHELVALIDRLD